MNTLKLHRFYQTVRIINAKFTTWGELIVHEMSAKHIHFSLFAFYGICLNVIFTIVKV